MELKDLFPKKFTQCPNCESERRVAKMVVEDLIENDRASQNLQGWIVAHQSILTPDKPHFSMPVVQSVFDICYDCGTLYCIEVGVGVGMKEANKPPPMNFGRQGNN